jgi:hypothetical protein
MLNTRKLPVGVQDFEDLRTRNCLYVDKTEYVYRLVNVGKSYFLFYKSLSPQFDFFILCRLSSTCAMFMNKKHKRVRYNRL